ncbi:MULTISPECIES: DoxX family protein [unclassified Nocardia]|uniref:DoxX family protein n=1 Tax=unclassified Nocardia TaxID=2637762 RepID=UPI0024A97D11|nr:MULTISPECIES: DoxX family protein [unclassified Nocardia]
MTAPTTGGTSSTRSLLAAREGVDATATDIGLLIARVGFGGLFAVHGSQKLFGWFNGYGLEATNAGFDQMGYNPGAFFGTLAGLSELVGGLLLLLGLLTPLAAAIVLGTTVNILNATWSDGFAMWEMGALFALAAAALAFTGPGRFSLDHGRPWARQGVVWGVAAVVLAIVAGVLTLILKAVL